MQETDLTYGILPKHGAQNRIGRIGTTSPDHVRRVDVFYISMDTDALEMRLDLESVISVIK